MANIEITNNAPFGIVIWNPVFQDEILEAGAAETWPAGTVLGRVTAGGNIQPYDSGAADGTEIPIGVLSYEQEFTGAGTLPGRMLISGQVRLEDLTEFGVGAITSKAVIDQLRSVTIIALPTTQHALLDNQ